MSPQPYILPSSTRGLPKGLDLTQFIQTVLVGLSNIDGTLVRPKWQDKDPQFPGVEVNWIAFGIESINADFNAYVDSEDSTKVSFQRHEEIEVMTHFYGPKAYETAALVRDGFQLSPNRIMLTKASMAYVDVTAMRHVPDFVNARYVNRYTMGIRLRRQILRTYPIPTILSAAGTIYTVVGNEEFLVTFQAGSPAITTESGNPLDTESNETLVEE